MRRWFIDRNSTVRTESELTLGLQQTWFIYKEMRAEAATVRRPLKQDQVEGSKRAGAFWLKKPKKTPASRIYLNSMKSS